MRFIDLLASFLKTTTGRALFLLTLLVMVQTPANAAPLYPDTEHTGVSPDDPLAISSLQTLVEQTARKDGPFALSLYRPLRHLGLIQLSSGLAEEALDTFGRMQNLVHRHDGVYSIHQLESVDYAIEALLALGDGRRIDQHHTLRLKTAELTYSESDPELSFARLRAADWLRNTSRFSEANELYESVTPHLDETRDPDLALRTWRSLALTSYLQERCCATNHLQVALDIVERGPFDMTERQQVRQDLVDLMVLTSNDEETPPLVSGARPAYLGFGDTTEFLEFHRDRMMKSQRGEFIELTELTPDAIQPVGTPVAMCGRTFADLASHARDFRLDVHLTLDAEGRPSRIDIDGDAPHRLKHYLRDSLRAGRYRPATDQSGSYTESEISFQQTFTPTPVAVSSASSVSDWQYLMVAQACQQKFSSRI